MISIGVQSSSRRHREKTEQPYEIRGNISAANLVNQWALILLKPTSEYL